MTEHRGEVISINTDKRRAEVAWILWCASEGYLLAADRDLMTNWFLEGSASTDHPDDNRLGWLEAADAVIAALESGDSHAD